MWNEFVQVESIFNSLFYWHSSNNPAGHPWLHPVVNSTRTGKIIKLSLNIIKIISNPFDTIHKKKSKLMPENKL